MSSLLPLNRTPLESALEAAADEDLAIMLRRLYNPDTCPASLLYLLAWAWSVDRWDDRWSEAVKRSVIRSAFFVHAHKGTIGALRRVVEPFGYLIEVVEWWETTPQGVPGTFALKVGVSDEGISDETYQELSALIDDARPVSRHMIGLEIGVETKGSICLGLSVSHGDVLDVYPPQQLDIVVTGQIGRGGREHTIDTLDIAHG
ncbi:phage tail protein I [Pseudomonas asiatica]|uniref:Phage tail protein I n=1 Tax=Pseudomonas asiatica TaxID=2219225 RepID=A0ABU5L4A3_9PSED|nr:phage tail protein I [Pseudomonas asiatica]MDZ5740958.1 phage tail protein I [Pseudomonas asiatica]MDZ5746279.1 phage tail protein I [Pseudomonas asiatica]MDZ5751276.1 phage tail protein I [Pseudomonas asiatica]MDZ5756256.1 phage tail protein I [Pseudomonas asiatica]